MQLDALEQGAGQTADAICLDGRCPALSGGRHHGHHVDATAVHGACGATLRSSTAAATEQGGASGRSLIRGPASVRKPSQGKHALRPTGRPPGTIPTRCRPNAQHNAPTRCRPNAQHNAPSLSSGDVRGAQPAAASRDRPGDLLWNGPAHRLRTLRQGTIRLVIQPLGAQQQQRSSRLWSTGATFLIRGGHGPRRCRCYLSRPGRTRRPSRRPSCRTLGGLLRAAATHDEPSDVTLHEQRSRQPAITCQAAAVEQRVAEELRRGTGAHGGADAHGGAGAACLGQGLIAAYCRLPY